MKKAILFLLAFICYNASFAQITYETFESRKLNSTRKLKIKLPKDYDENSELRYPLVVVLDGEYMFEPVAGQIDFQTYFDDMPDCIVVGIMHGDTRFYDMYSDEVSGLPIDFGAKFYEFVGKELIPYLDGKYNASKFRVAVGHNLTANFINSFLLKEIPLFQAYVNISPDFVGDMAINIPKRLEWAKEEVIYYLATANEDIKHIRSSVLQANKEISTIENPKLTYYFDDFDEATHYSLATRGIARAFDKIFDIYKPISEKEIEEKIMTYEGTLDKYIIERYNRIDDLFGIKKNISEEEFQKVADAAQEREDLESLEKLGKLVNKYYPKSNLGTYYLALYAEKAGKTKKAMKLYEDALVLDESIVINKDFILSKVEDLKMVENDED